MYKIAEDDLYWDESDNVDEVTKDFLERVYIFNITWRIPSFLMHFLDDGQGSKATIDDFL